MYAFCFAFWIASKSASQLARYITSSSINIIGTLAYIINTEPVYDKRE